MKGHTASIPDFMQPDALANGIIPGMQVTPKEFSVLVDTICKLITDMTITIPITMDQGDWLAAVVDIKAREVHTGSPVHSTGHVMARFQGDKLVEVYNSFDFLDFFEQLGQLPENTLALLLSGTNFN